MLTVVEVQVSAARQRSGTLSTYMKINQLPLVWICKINFYNRTRSKAKLIHKQRWVREGQQTDHQTEPHEWPLALHSQGEKVTAALEEMTSQIQTRTVRWHLNSVRKGGGHTMVEGIISGNVNPLTPHTTHPALGWNPASRRIMWWLWRP